jgi:predicted ATPase
MLETLREYAVEQLQQSGELDDLQRLHHDWFAKLLDEEAEAHVDRLMGTAPQSQPWLLESSIRGQETENIRAAVGWALKKRRWHGWKRE